MLARIQNRDDLVSHGHFHGRSAMLEILEAGLQGADPYNNTRKLISLDNNRLIIGGKEFEPVGPGKHGHEVIDLSEIKNIYLFGACKGVQRVAKAIEDVLGDRLTGGHVIDKKGHPIIMERIGVTLGGHPIPDEDCIKGCQRILEYTETITKDDLVFTCVGNGVSSLLTMPVPGVSLEDLKRITYAMQIERGVPTSDLNPIRNHLDMMKGGKISRYIQPARAIHIIAIEPGNYDQLIHRNLWLHSLPDRTTFEDALESLHKWDAYDVVPASVREFLEKADPVYETVKAEEFLKGSFRIFGTMPGFRQTAKLYPAMQKAKELGFRPIILTEMLFKVEAKEAGKFMASICNTIEHSGYPFKPPCALFSSGEMVVTVGQEKGVGGRNQEFTLSAAQTVSGSENVIIASVDTDGTDGPGFQFTKTNDNMPICLAGGIVDGMTVEDAKKIGIDINDSLKKHDTSPALWRLNSGIVATPGVSLIDLTVGLVLGRSKKESHLYY